MAVDKEAISLSRVYSYYSKCNLPLFRVARHIVGPLVLHCRWVAEHATALAIWLLRRW